MLAQFPCGKYIIFICYHHTEIHRAEEGDVRRHRAADCRCFHEAVERIRVREDLKSLAAVRGNESSFVPEGFSASV